MLNFGSYKIARFLPNRVITTKGKSNKKVLYLTFDDGPNPDFTIKIADLLQRHSAKGSFFCVGQNIAKHPEIAQSLIERGHLIANHSNTHSAFIKQSLASQLNEANACQQEIENINPDNIKAFRAPQGLLSFRLLIKLLIDKWRLVHWSYDSKDYQQKSFDEQKKIFDARPVSNGEILLFHDDNQLAVELLEHLLPQWTQQGYVFHTVAELIGGKSE